MYRFQYYLCLWLFNQFSNVWPPFSNPVAALFRDFGRCRFLSRSVSVKSYLENVLLTPLSFVEIAIEMSVLGVQADFVLIYGVFSAKSA